MPVLPPHAFAVRNTWLRCFTSANPLGHGSVHGHSLYGIGNAAARETLVTATSHMSAFWTSLFDDLLRPGPDLRWLEDGPGLGRDARIAYSSLLGRYLARAYLTTSEGVLALVPLDVVQRRPRATPYSIYKVPAGNRASWPTGSVSTLAGDSSSRRPRAATTAARGRGTDPLDRDCWTPPRSRRAARWFAQAVDAFCRPDVGPSCPAGAPPTTNSNLQSLHRATMARHCLDSTT